MGGGRTGQRHRATSEGEAPGHPAQIPREGARCSGDRPVGARGSGGVSPRRPQPGSPPPPAEPPRLALLGEDITISLFIHLFIHL